MAANGKTRTVRDWFVGLSTPAKALFFVALACVAALVVALIVVNGSPRRGSAGTTAGVEADSMTANQATGTAGAVATSAASPHGAAGSAIASAAAAAAAAGGTTTTKKSTGSTGNSKSGGTGGTDSGAPQDGSGSPAPSEPPVLTSELRKTIAAELVAAEKRAAAEAAAKYPVDPKKGGTLSNSNQYEQMRSDLIDTYIAVIVKKYGLTTEQTIDILILDAATSE